MQQFIKTDNDVKIEMHKKKTSKNFKRQSNQEQIIKPRYGTTIDLNTNKITDELDKHTLRNQLIAQSIDETYKKYRISRINIDSSYRNIYPKNIISKYITISNPFEFTKNSNKIQIRLPFGHGIKMNDTITISGLIPRQITQRPNTLTLKKNSKYMFINQTDHGFTGNNNVIKISGVTNLSSNSTSFINNIPLIVINSEHKVILIDNNGVIDRDNYLIDIDIYSNSDFIYSGDFYTIDVMSFNGIHLKYINASYPIIDLVQQGYQNVVESGPDYIIIEIDVTASDISEIGSQTNDNIIIGLISESISAYPDPEYYTYPLNQMYYNVKKIKLVSSEIPNTEMLIKNMPPNLKNSSLYWQIRDDGDFIYKVDISSGNYDAETLMKEITNKISEVDRMFGEYFDKTLYYPKCIPKIIINPNNNLFSIQILSKIILSEAIVISTDTYSDNYMRIIITQPYHNLNVGDNVTIIGSVNVIDHTEEIIDPSTNDTTIINYYVPNNIINKNHLIEKINGINSYVIKLDKYNTITTPDVNNEDIINGGNAIQIIYPLTIRLLFNKCDTFGSVLGYKYINEESSITIFDKIITNKTSYIDGSNLNTVGMTDYNEPMLNFRTFPYIVMASQLFSLNVNLQDSSGVFAKLFLTGNTGSMIYDQYVQISENLRIPKLNELTFSFLTPDNRLYSFNDQNHSYTLEIYEELEENENIKN